MLTDPFQRGLADHQAGRLQEAEAAYREVLAGDPAHAGAVHMLGIIALQVGRNDLAVDYIGRSIALQSAQPAAHSNLGNALRNLGRLPEAEASYREALRLQPDFPEVHYNLGNALRDLGRPAEAEASYREGLRLRPDFPDALNNLGNVLRDLGRLAEAEATLREVLRLQPGSADAQNDLGSVLRDLGRLPEAEASYREALRLQPDYFEAHNNLGNALRELGRLAEAAASYREALRLKPDSAVGHSNLGNALRDLGRLVEAEASYREALRLGPDDPEVNNSLGDLLLLGGQFAEGWEQLEWRWKTRQMSAAARHFSAPMWGGEAIGDRVILLHAEQGYGDTLQFCRYVPAIAAGARVILEVHAPLVRLLSQLPGVMQIVTRGDDLPAFDLHCPLMSLPRVVGTTLDTIPAAVPYLAADPAEVAGWRERLAGIDGLRVGLVWAGGKRSVVGGHRFMSLELVDGRRSISLETMAPLGDTAGVSFFSLQKGEPASQTADPPRGLALHDFTADLQDFADTAALIENLDLVISVDTSVAHLAGALGKPVWLLNRFDTCWRWLLERDDSPWYPRLRQFRQPNPGDWNTVIGTVHDALTRLAAGDRDQLRPRSAKP